MDVQEGSEVPFEGLAGLRVPPGGVGGVSRPYQWAVRGWEALLVVRDWSEGPPTGQEGSGGPPKGWEALS